MFPGPRQVAYAGHMPIYRLTQDAIKNLPAPTFAERGIKERYDLQRLLKDNIGIVAPDVLVISEEFDEWEDSKRRIDLLGIDRSGKLVVIELKRDEDGGHMELQAIRYAAMIHQMTFQQAIKTYQAHLDKSGRRQDAQDELQKFLETSEPLNDDAILGVRIVLVSADFAKELTTAVLWLNKWLDIRCVKVKLYVDDDRNFLEVQQVVPLPEAAEYQVSISRFEDTGESGQPTGYFFMNTGEGSNNGRSWDDCYDYGFMIAGGDEQHQEYVKGLKIGDKVCAYLSGHGYVGIGEVIAEAVRQRDFVPAGQSKRLIEIPPHAKLQPDRLNDESKCDWCAGVRWLFKLKRENAVLRNRFRRPTFQPIKQQALVDELLEAFKRAVVTK
jgi:hypothetical protein